MKLALSRNQKSNPPRAGYTLVEIMIVVSLIGLLTAIGIPNFLKSRECTQLNSIINNVRVVENAKDEWALQNHKGSGEIPDWASLSDYLKGGTVKSVVSKTYTINPIGTNAYAVATVKLGSYDGGTPITSQ